MTFRHRILAVFMLAVSASAAATEITELEYPRTIAVDDARLTIHHPVIDHWEDFRVVEGWIPIEVRLPDAKTQWVGAVRARANTRVDLARRVVALSGQQVLETRFSAPGAPEEALRLARHAVSNHPHTIVLDALLHALASDFQVPAQGGDPAQLNHQPPRIVVAQQPTQLLLIDKKPVAAPVTGTGLEFVVNTDWKLFHHPLSGNWYVLNQGTWQSQAMLATGGWRTTVELPDDFQLLALGDEWVEVRNAMPPRLPAEDPPPFIVSLEPTELVQIDGPPRLQAAGDSGLRYVSNTDRDLFALGERWYLLLSGRWFVAGDLDGPWSTVEQLPDAFQAIPEAHPRARVRAAIPGTVESVVAMMEATLPRRREVSTEEADRLVAGYVGPPRFEPIEGTDLARAVNSPQYVFRHNNFYYLCHQAAWFMSRDPNGPWTVAHTVPDEIYRIPATDPAYFVTFLRPVAAANKDGRKAAFEFNGGYHGTFSTGVTVVQGTGWRYPPGLWYDPMGRPIYWSHPYTYGWYGSGYGPYGARFYHFGQYWGPQSITLESVPRNDSAFQDPRLARRGYDYTTIGQQRDEELGRALNADDDYYTDSAGNVYRRDGGDWSRHTGNGWSTMAELERQYGGSGAIGAVGAAPEQRQAYRQNPNDIERIKRYHESRQRSYNMYGYVTVYR
jgi:hypothetical protein